MEKIAVMSGKGGVGKSVVTAAMAAIASKDLRVGVLDADVTGPSIPVLFGAVGEKIFSEGKGMKPVDVGGIKLMSFGFLLPKQDSPVIWRGPLISNGLQQMLSETEWGDLDLLLIDLPPGTSDASLTIIQSGISGVVIVMTPQELVVSDVVRSISMAKQMEVPILALVENMSFSVCPKCKERIDIFGPSQAEPLAKEHDIGNVARIPLDPRISVLADEGKALEFASLESLQCLKPITKKPKKA